jgi:Ca2+-binding EF-hand superfamily protein
MAQDTRCTLFYIALTMQAFAELDTDASGRISTDDIVAVLKSKLPEDEVRWGGGSHDGRERGHRRALGG